MVFWAVEIATATTQVVILQLIQNASGESTGKRASPRKSKSIANLSPKNHGRKNQSNGNCGQASHLRVLSMDTLWLKLYVSNYGDIFTYFIRTILAYLEEDTSKGVKGQKNTYATYVTTLQICFAKVIWSTFAVQIKVHNSPGTLWPCDRVSIPVSPCHRGHFRVWGSWDGVNAQRWNQVAQLVNKWMLDFGIGIIPKRSNMVNIIFTEIKQVCLHFHPPFWEKPWGLKPTWRSMPNTHTPCMPSCSGLRSVAKEELRQVYGILVYDAEVEIVESHWVMW